MYNAIYQSHAGSWAITLLLFFIAYFLIVTNKDKAGKIVHMILRLFYVIMIVTGGWLLFTLYLSDLTFIIKALLALALIYFMEVILTRAKKKNIDRKVKMYHWLQFGVTALLVVLIGFNVLSF
ncbi:DUF1516 family protein [Alkalihalobacillus sp. LMS39]|uniref:DUF1516 family protein n=1 Tax=Alkalihalobacillus sp. LMS39 TaxID=2924032 RepID=UPI001FB3E73F|nr:DUF1516 family protein [Alkalihalobacillus sp. LMS39]UOE93279.1 DUF1516 family protein [Alkalihalobacillus sp. LMS39]